MLFRSRRRSLDSPRSRHDLLLSDEFAVQKLVDQKLLISISVYTLHRNLEFKLQNNKKLRIEPVVFSKANVRLSVGGLNNVPTSVSTSQEIERLSNVKYCLLKANDRVCRSALLHWKVIGIVLLKLNNITRF